MNKTLSERSAPSAGWEPKCPFDLVVTYEDAATRDRALRLGNSLTQQLRDDYDLQCSWWRLPHLQDTTIMSHAVDAALKANMIVVSLQDSEEIPALARQWLEAWIPFKTDQKSALVTLLRKPDATKGRLSRLHLYLQQAARRARMDFFVHSLEDPFEMRAASTEHLDQRAKVITPVLQEILRHPSPREWVSQDQL